MTGLRLRRARAADADLIADLHTASWRTAYRGLVLDRFLDSGLAQQRRRHWRATMAGTRPRDLVLIAEDGKGPAGFISVWVRRGSPAFIDNLHAHPARRRQGVGSFLMKEAARLLAALGQRAAYLWVLDNNLAARRFYAAIGGATVLREFEMFGNARVSHSRIFWRDIVRLARR
jgi:ribosomal protein S18 acetylase RimI-like enzyme